MHTSIRLSRTGQVWAAVCLAASLMACVDAGPSEPDLMEPATPPSEPPDPGEQPAPLEEIEIPVPELLRGQGAMLEVGRLYQDAPASSSIDMIPTTADSIPVGFEGADLLSISVHAADGTLVDSVMVAGQCRPPLPPAQSQRVLQVPTEHGSIQEAIDQARPGDTVYVHPGIYRENVRLRSGIRLIGAGAWRTTLTGSGQSQSLIDFTGAQDVVVRGFRLRNVGLPGGCADPDNPFACSGDWYAAAVYGDGHNFEDPRCSNTSILLANNIIEGNSIGVMLYFHARAVIRNNLFVGNTHAFVANHLQDHALLASNVFARNRELAIGSQAAYLDILNNVIVGSRVGVWHEYIQTGRIRCNVFFDVAEIGERVDIGKDGNVILDPGFVDAAAEDYRLGEDSPAHDLGCDGPGLSRMYSASPDPGAFGGTLGSWFEHEIQVEDLLPASP